MTVLFDNGRVAGVSACNQYSGAYTIEDRRLVLGPQAGTMMACPGPAMALEQAFREAFAGTVAYEVDGGQLVVTAASGTKLVFQTEPAPSLEGATWSVTGYNNGGQAVVSPLANPELTLVFRDGTLSGSSGCNRYTGSYKRDGDRLTLGPAASTRMACPAPEVMQPEQAFLAALATVATWSTHDDRLDLRTAEGARVVTARMAPAAR